MMKMPLNHAHAQNLNAWKNIVNVSVLADTAGNNATVVDVWIILNLKPSDKRHYKSKKMEVKSKRLGKFKGKFSILKGVLVNALTASRTTVNAFRIISLVVTRVSAFVARIPLKRDSFEGKARSTQVITSNLSTSNSSSSSSTLTIFKEILSIKAFMMIILLKIHLFRGGNSVS